MAGTVALVNRQIDWLLRSTRFRNICSGRHDGSRLLRPPLAGRTESLMERAHTLEDIVLSQCQRPEQGIDSIFVLDSNGCLRCRYRDAEYVKVGGWESGFRACLV